MDDHQLSAVKKLSRLKQDLAQKVLEDPDAAIARMEEFLKQYPGPRVANIAQEFLAKAKEAKGRLDKDWAEAQRGAEKEAVAGKKVDAFRILRSFVDAHPGTRQASTASGMMLGWVANLRGAARKAAEAGHLERAVEMLDVADNNLPNEITGPLQKDLEHYMVERNKLRSSAEAERRQEAAILEKAAQEADSLPGKRYNFEGSAKICREGSALIKTPGHKKELEGVAALYSRAAQVLERMRLALELAKSVEVPGLGRIKEPVDLTGWDEHGLTYKPKMLGEQTMPWREISAENLLQAAQALRVASGKSWADLYDTGALAFAAGAPSIAAEKLEEACAADPAARALAEAPLRLLKPAPKPKKAEGFGAERQKQ
jgi:tetratricopeptide (TPR) repeat protein